MDTPPRGLCEADFEAIEAAVMETERGRWFLSEYARRTRAQDTARMLAAVERLETRAGAIDAAEEEARRHVERAAGLLRQIAAIVRTARAGGDPAALDEPADDLGDDEPASEFAPPARGAIEQRLDSLARLGALSVAERLKLFR